MGHGRCRAHGCIRVEGGAHRPVRETAAATKRERLRRRGQIPASRRERAERPLVLDVRGLSGSFQRPRPTDALAATRGSSATIWISRPAAAAQRR